MNGEAPTPFSSPEDGRAVARRNLRASWLLSFLATACLSAGPGLPSLRAATFFGPTPYLSAADIPAGLYVSGKPTVLEDFEDGKLDPSIKASAGQVVPPGAEGLIDSVDADDGVIDGSGLKGHSWFTEQAAVGIKFTFPPGTIAAGVVWTDGYDPVTFEAFGPGNVSLGKIGPVGGFSDNVFNGTTAEDRFFGVRDAGGIESIFISCQAGGMELDHVQYEVASKPAYVIDAFTVSGGSGTLKGGAFSVTGTAGQPEAKPAVGGGDYSLAAGFWSLPTVRPEALYVVAGNNSIEQFGPGGAGSVFSSTGLNGPHGAAFDKSGNLYVANNGNNTILKFTPGGVPAVYANTGLNGPNGIAFDSAGNLYVANTGDHTIRKITPYGIGSLFASLAPSDVLGLAFDTSDNLYASGNNVINRVAPDGTATVFANTGLNNPLGLALDGAGNLYAANNGNNTIQRFTPDGVGSVFANTGLNLPVGLAFDGAGNLYAANDGNGTITRFTPDGAGSAFASTAPDAPTFIAFGPEPPATTTFTANLFDNTSGTDNGGFGVSEVGWLAGRFCVGSQAYSLDSVGVLLNSQNFAGAPGPPASVQLRIYFDDPMHRRPLANTGVGMNLVGKANPFSLVNGQEIVSWTPTTPLNLVPNTCYWVVLSREGGGDIGAKASFTKPIGVAGGYGASRSSDAGAHWGASDDSFDFMMKLGGTPISKWVAPPLLAANTSTLIPGGTETFTSLENAPGFNGDSLAFIGSGPGGRTGIYSTTAGSPQLPVRVVDLNTPIPGGTGNFQSFGTEAGIIIVGGNVLFAGSGAGGLQGIYMSNPGNNGVPIPIADTATPIPGGAGAFTGFQHALGYDGKNVAAVATGAGGQEGVYRIAVISPPQVGSPLRLADTTTAIPDGDGNFTGFPAGPAISGDDVAFIGNGSDGQQGLYRVAVDSPPQAGEPRRIADTSTPIPEGAGLFTAFGTDLDHPVDPAMTGDRVAFVGSGSDGQGGVYSVILSTPARTAVPLRVADTSTPIPGGNGKFTGFGAVGISDTDIAFLGHGDGGQTGIYDMTGGSLRKVIAVGESIQAKRITGLDFSRAGLFGDPVAFQATFEDGTQGIFRVDVAATEPEVSITSIENIQGELQLTFTSVAGQIYIVQTRSDLSSGAWVNLSDAPVVGTGDTTQARVSIAPADEQQFVRIRAAF